MTLWIASVKSRNSARFLSRSDSSSQGCASDRYDSACSKLESKQASSFRAWANGSSASVPRIASVRPAINGMLSPMALEKPAPSKNTSCPEYPSAGTFENRSRLGWFILFTSFRIHFDRAVQPRRIVQCKMILKRDLIPMQDDTENGGGLTGELRPNARTYADRRDVESRSDQ